MNAKTVV